MLLCIVCDFVLFQFRIILSLLMALKMFVGGKFARPGGGDSIETNRISVTNLMKIAHFL